MEGPAVVLEHSIARHLEQRRPDLRQPAREVTPPQAKIARARIPEPHWLFREYRPAVLTGDQQVKSVGPDRRIIRRILVLAWLHRDAVGMPPRAVRDVPRCQVCDLDLYDNVSPVVTKRHRRQDSRDEGAAAPARIVERDIDQRSRSRDRLLRGATNSPPEHQRVSTESDLRHT
jgi:hypothetical protein